MPGCLAAEGTDLEQEGLVEEAVAEPLEGEALAASDRMSDVIRMLGDRAELAVNGEGLVTGYPVRLDELSESGLSQWYADTRLVRGETAATELARSVEGARATGGVPTDRQAAGLAELHDNALGTVDVTWNAILGSPQLIEGPLYARRRVSAEDAANEFLAARADMVSALFPRGVSDRLVHVGSSVIWDGTLEEHVFQRQRDGVPFEIDHVSVFVSTDRHRMGAGIVMRVFASWEAVGAELRDEPWIAEARARAAASDALSVETRGEDAAWTERRIICRSSGDGSRACRPVWRVHAIDPRLTATSSEDTALIDARTGELAGLEENAHNYDGVVRATSWMPYDTADSYRPLSRARLVSGANTRILGVDGSYTAFNPPGFTTASVGLENVGAPMPGVVWNRDTYDCSTTPNPHYAVIGLGGTDDIFAPTSDTTLYRSRYTYWNAIQWNFRALAPLNNFLQVDDELAYSVNIGGGGQTVGCGSHMLMGLGIAADAQTDSSVLHHEFGHYINSCTRGWNAGCPGELSGLRTMVPETMSHGFGDAFAAWATSYAMPGYTRIWLSYLRYNGIGDPSDLMLHESEIDGTPPAAGWDSFCRNVSGVYQCTASEACYGQAHDGPRCMRRAASAAACQAMFPTTLWPYLEWAPYGTDATAGWPPTIGICKADGYVNGVMPELLAADLAHYRGYYGVADLMATTRNYDWYTQLAVNAPAPANTIHDIMALRSPRFTTTRAVHHIDTESFAWLDDAPDSARHAEISRIARASALTQSNGGATGIGLRFNTTTDSDVFLLSVPQGETYDISVNTVSTSIDLCLTVAREIDGVVVGTAGCSDGTANRNATLGINTGTYSRYIAYVSNVLGIANIGTYSLVTDTRNDDFPDGIAYATSSRALRPGTAEAGVLDSVADGDLFRYDRPATAGAGSLVFTLSTTASPIPQLAVYYSADETIPSTIIVSSSTGTATVTSPSVGHYYVRVANAGITSGIAYSITATAGTCGTTCSGSGTFASPQRLPTLEGGEVVDGLASFAPSWHAADCANGTLCDWYQVELAANERFSVTSYTISPGVTCDLEIAAFSPPDPDGSDYFLYDGLRYPFVWDSGGSPDTGNGGQLTFVARRAGTHRIAIRANGSTACTRYYLDTRRMVADTGTANAPPPYTW